MNMVMRFKSEGQSGGLYPPRSIQVLFRRVLKISHVRKEASVHTLRYFYAAPLLEKGADLRIIQELPGHKNNKTTDSKRSVEPRSAICTHASRHTKKHIPKPLGQLNNIIKPQYMLNTPTSHYQQYYCVYKHDGKNPIGDDAILK